MGGVEVLARLVAHHCLLMSFMPRVLISMHCTTIVVDVSCMYYVHCTTPLINVPHRFNNQHVLYNTSCRCASYINQVICQHSQGSLYAL